MTPASPASSPPFTVCSGIRKLWVNKNEDANLVQEPVYILLFFSSFPSRCFWTCCSAWNVHFHTCVKPLSNCHFSERPFSPTLPKTHHHLSLPPSPALFFSITLTTLSEAIFICVSLFVGRLSTRICAYTTTGILSVCCASELSEGWLTQSRCSIIYVMPFFHSFIV